MISLWRKRIAARHDRKKQGLDDNLSIELVIPRHFRCPISLDLMKDPVTLSTGVTYDRESIEKWIAEGNNTCPFTNQVLRSLEPVPNHSIRKMIQDWCVENKSYGIERIPTPRIPITSYEVSEILSKIMAVKDQKEGEGCRDLAVKIKVLMMESERNRRCIVAHGAGSVLSSSFETLLEDSFDKNVSVLEEILSVLAMMLPLDGETKYYLGSNSSLRCMAWFMGCGDLSAQKNAVLTLQEIISSDQRKACDFSEIEGAMEALVKLIKEPICPKSTKASLLTIYHIVSSSSSSHANEKIITKLVEMGLVAILVEMLVESERSICEKALGILNEICNCEVGREKANEHAMVTPVLVKKLLRVSDLATEFSVSILWKLSKNEKGESGGVLVEALQVGAFQKLLLLLQFGCSERTKEKASELLKMLNMHKETLECIDSMDFKHLKRPF